MNLPGIYDIFHEQWSEYQEVHLISDTHFNDKELFSGANRIIKDDEFVKLINSKCGRKSVLIHLGDCGDIEYIGKLRAGLKILILGNHDTGKSNYKREICKEYYEVEKYTKTEIIADMKEKYPGWKITISDYEMCIPSLSYTTAYYVVFADNCLFDYVYEGALTLGEKIIVSHEEINAPGMINIHGHDHSGRKSDERHINICPDATGIFEPVSLNKLLKEGFTSHIKTNRRSTIDNATKRARKRGKRK